MVDETALLHTWEYSMMRLLGSTVFALALATLAGASQHAPVLPQNVRYNPAIPTPRSYLGFEIGERHLLHHELVGYLKRLAESSDRIVLKEYARSHGGRPLIVLAITSPENHRRLDEIREQHLQLTDPAISANVEIDSLPAVINMGYSVHGNEPSGGNVAPLVAYYLAAATGSRHERLLSETVILLDPCLNPDGFDRFAHWANNNRGRVPNADPYHREHREPWPSGRTNYYWFDLNRDWLPAQHPGSRGRLRLFHHWKPNVVLDFHEMGTDSTYFFQPGAPRRNNPLTPARTFELTRLFAERHAAALDRAGSLYYSEEGYDDFYMGKGSTYPDLHGAVGILFEQASARGHVQESIHGPLTLAFAVRNHWLSSMSSLDATLALRRELLEHQRQFYADALALARNHTARAYLVAAPHDSARLDQFLQVLQLHDIRAYQLKKDQQLDGMIFKSGEAYVIPTAQPEFRFLQDLFARRKTFSENIFYDVSTWTLPLAFHLQVAEWRSALDPGLLGERWKEGRRAIREPRIRSDDLAYVIDWRGYFAAKVLYRLLDAGAKVKVATKPFAIETADGTRSFGYGSLLVPLGIQPENRDVIVKTLREAHHDGVTVLPASTGWTPTGIDFGSRYFRLVDRPRVLLITGGSAYEAGEVWHLLDHRMHMPVTLVEEERLASVPLANYTAVVMVSGEYGGISSAGAEKLKRFVAEGGTIVAIGTASQWLQSRQVAPIEFRRPHRAAPSDTASPPPRRPFANAETDAALQLVRGAIFETQVDHTHPIGYGFRPGAMLPVFRNNRVFLELTKSPYATPVVYTEAPLMSGYVSDTNLATLSGSASVAVYGVGRGRVIAIAENPNFRAFWYGTNRLFLNAVFFGSLIR